MAVISDFRNVPEEAQGAAVALGNFDGVHEGHVAVIDSAGEIARAKDVPLGVLIFEPPPRMYFQPEGTPFRIMTPETRRDALREHGVDIIYELPFNKEMSQMSPEAFVRDVLVEGLKLKHLSVGFDFRFGRGREGDVNTLATLAKTYGFSFSVQERITDGFTKISSTAIRTALQEGKPETAGHLLGRYWRATGTVEMGEQRGRTISFPTANMRLGDLIQPMHGVYAVWAQIEGENKWRAGVANFGRTPTTGLRDPLLETHLFDFDEEIYGKQMTVALVDFLRREKKFDSFEALTLQIAADAADAKQSLKAMSGGSLSVSALPKPE